MKNLSKLILSAIFLFTSITNVTAAEITKTLQSSPLDKSSTIAVSVKEVETGKTVFDYNGKKLLHPASTLKVFTTFPSLDVLGEDYGFETSFYTYKDNLYIKLGADPFLTSLNLKDAAKQIKALGFRNFKNVYIEDRIIDNVEWGIGWMWDDGTNPLMQKYSAYNLDNNLTTLTVSKDANDSPIINSEFKVPCINALKSGNSTNIYAIRHDWVSPEIICLKGTVAGNTAVQVPINNLERYFENRLFYYLNRSKIKVENQSLQKAKVPEKAIFMYRVAHSASSVANNILKNSSNMNAEVMAKVAGGVKAEKTGTIEEQINLFYNYWKKNEVDTTGIIIADASGVSRNNLVTTDFMTNALNKLYKTQGSAKMFGYLAQPGEGTMDNRLLNYRGSIFLKTGTLSNISGLTGYIIANNGKTYSVAILIQNFAYPITKIKQFENELIGEIKKL